MTSGIRSSAGWPALPLAEWHETQETAHLWTQVVGKVKLALTPFLNEWWNVAFTVTPRGLTTGLIHAGPAAFAIDFDLIDHALVYRASDGRMVSEPLVPKTVASFYHEVLGMLRSMGVEVTIDPLPVEIPNPVPCDIDHHHDAYDPEAVRRWW